MIVNMAQTGRLGGKIDDAQFKQLLEQLSQQMTRSDSKVNFNRRRAAMDSDDDDDYGCWDFFFSFFAFSPLLTQVLIAFNAESL